ncbi:hypothetical protein [Nostoc linckia]|uniref:hypothetical protein n=1 Tax=Nostoc linckia TaxID=92942 RepID=UPI00117FA54E|nr:hypothetical protein [Nostoc linckia]
MGDTESREENNKFLWWFSIQWNTHFQIESLYRRKALRPYRVVYLPENCCKSSLITHHSSLITHHSSLITHHPLLPQCPFLLPKH